MKALSVKQPWAWLILNGYKPVENRSKNTKYRGKVIILACKSFDMEGYLWVRKHFPQIPMPSPLDFERGGIVGIACITSSGFNRAYRLEGTWWQPGLFGWTMESPRPVVLIPMRGQLGLFDFWKAVEKQPDVRILALEDILVIPRRPNRRSR